MTDLRALLGDKYDDVMQAACGCDGTRVPHCFECSDSTWDHECPGPVPCTHRAAGAVLARVLPDLLAGAWDEGHQAGHEDARAEVKRVTAVVEAVREYAAARQANIDHGPLLSARKAAHDALLAALARLDEEPQP